MNTKVDELCEQGISVGWSKAAGGNGEKLSTSYPAFFVVTFLEQLIFRPEWSYSPQFHNVPSKVRDYTYPLCLCSIWKWGILNNVLKRSNIWQLCNNLLPPALQPRLLPLLVPSSKLGFHSLFSPGRRVELKNKYKRNPGVILLFGETVASTFERLLRLEVEQCRIGRCKRFI